MSNKVHDKKAIKQDKRPKVSPYEFLYKNYSYRSVLPLDMSHIAAINDLKYKIHYKYNEYF